MNEAPGAEGLPPSLRLLKWLVIVLTVTMIVGLITLIGLLVIRMPDPANDLSIPTSLQLPDGTKAEAVTKGKGWIAIVTAKNEILVFDALTGKLRHRYPLGPAE
ncbi:DUF6476 family protein [Acidimangrovimonas pyrenivorans]|uniref:DUF6476 family protein n=1 Tax=Acidimangrovimonas pyrenivorans TaxID=2030798 RepID=A0ABV7AG50_9RHOB